MEGKERKSKMKPWLWTGGILLFLVAAFYLIVFLMSGKLKEFTEKQINKSFNTKVSFARLEISVFKAFPKVSVRFSDISIQEANNISGQDLLRAKELSVVFDVWDIINKNYRFKEILLDEAKLNLVTDKKGRRNFDVLKSDTTGSTDPLKAELHRVLIRDSEINVEDRKQKQVYRYAPEEIEFSGDLNASDFALAIRSKGMLEELEVNGKEFLKNKYIKLNAGLKVNSDPSKIELLATELSVANLQFLIRGSVEQNKKESVLDLHVDGKEMDIQSFFSLLPPEYSKVLAGYESEGRFYFKSSIKGKSSKNSDPLVKVDFGIEDGTIGKEGLELSLEQVQMKGTFSNKSEGDKSPGLRIRNFQALLGGQSIHANMYLRDFKKPHLDLDLQGKVRLADLQKFISFDSIGKMSGDAELDLEFAGYLKDLGDRSTVNRVKCNGTLNVNDVSVVHHSGHRTYDNVNARLRFTQSDLAIDDISGRTGKSDFQFNGKLENIVSWLLLPDQRVSLSGSFHSDVLNASELLQHNTSTKKDTAALHVKIPEKIDLNLSLSCGHFEFYKFKASDFSGKLLLSNRVIRTENIKFSAVGGKFTLNGKASQNGDRILTQSRIGCESVNLTELFAQCNNFGQKEITDKNLSGKLKADITFNCLWKSSLVAEMDELYTLADVQISDGELKKYEPLKALSKFVSVEELENVKFATLKNQVEISNQTIFIPSMQVNNNALDMQVNGRHSFRNLMEYHFRIRLSELLAAKYKSRRNYNPDEVEVAEKGGLNLFITMMGTPAKLDIRLDKKSARQNRKEEFKAEKKEIKQLFREEFRRKDSEKQPSSTDEKPKEKKKPKEIIRELKKKDRQEEEEQMQYE